MNLKIKDDRYLHYTKFLEETSDRPRQGLREEAPMGLQTSVRGQNGVEFDQQSTGHGPRHVTHLFALLLAEIANERLKILTSFLVDLQTSVRGQNRVEFDQESTGYGPRHVTHLLALSLAEITNERLKILTSLLVDIQTRVRGQKGIEFD